VANKKKSEGTSDAVEKLRDVQLDISSVRFKDATEFKTAFVTTDKEVRRAADAWVSKQADVIATLAKMRSLFSQRGSKALRQKAGITQGWTQYFAWFQRTYKIKMCLRTVINKIDMLGGKTICKSCKKMNGHTPSCPRYKTPNLQLSSRECKLIAGLSAGHDLVNAIEHGGNFQAAADEFKRSAPTQERLEAWTYRQGLPYQPSSGDVIAVEGEEFMVLEVRGISNEDNVPHRSEANSEPLTHPSVTSKTNAVRIKKMPIKPSVPIDRRLKSLNAIAVGLPRHDRLDE
jgi:hypothetical protein